MAEGGRQVFSALELGPGCLVLGLSSERNWWRGSRGISVSVLGGKDQVQV